jgi:NitT/TauT family transport system ATP-binding protein
MVEIEKLSIAYGEKTVFDKLSMSFAENRISVVLGGSGVGKTTLLNAVANLLPYGGSIVGAEGGVSYIFQKDRLIPTITVYKNLDLVLRRLIKDKKERKKRIEEMLLLLEISSEAQKYPAALSGGQQQRVAMARAFLYPSEVLLLDEPFQGLDIPLKDRLLKLLVKLNALIPRTVIFVTHAIDECLLCADDFFVLSGAPAEIALAGGIITDKSTRALTDKSLAEIRAMLLSALA